MGSGARGRAGLGAVRRPRQACLATIARMPIPSRREAAALLTELRPSGRFLRHSATVGEVAAFLAGRISQRGISVDRRLVEAAALLHDVDKLLPSRHPLKALGHGDAGARWLSERGFEELARPVANHPVTRLSDEERYRRWASFASREERIVAYADKRAIQRLVSLDQRFARWERRHPDYGERLTIARRRAERLERDICEAAGIAPTQVRRLRWVRDAMARA